MRSVFWSTENEALPQRRVFWDAESEAMGQRRALWSHESEALPQRRALCSAENEVNNAGTISILPTLILNPDYELLLNSLHSLSCNNALVTDHCL